MAGPAQELFHVFWLRWMPDQLCDPHPHIAPLGTVEKRAFYIVGGRLIMETLRGAQQPEAVQVFPKGPMSRQRLRQMECYGRTWWSLVSDSRTLSAPRRSREVQ